MNFSIENLKSIRGAENFAGCFWISLELLSGFSEGGAQGEGLDKEDESFWLQTESDLVVASKVYSKMLGGLCTVRPRLMNHWRPWHAVPFATGFRV